MKTLNEHGEFPVIKKIIEHIFQDQYEMGLDYIQLLHSKPNQKLPVLGLVYKEEGTGKSTFLELLSLIFQNNMTFITPDDLLGNWSSHWASKLIVASEESFFDQKEVLEKVKNIQTADKIMRTEKHADSQMIDCLVKFVFCSNDEGCFSNTEDISSRFWIIIVKPIPEDEKDVLLAQKMVDEIPDFMHFLNTRQLVHQNKHRLYFDLQYENLSQIKLHS